ncbi:MAG: tetratricopeptide repeat protein [Gammaproteobacteria bacterium]|nr:tetratricopeptide repeat protein [Gammaproteobacteria bacterium]
MEHLHEEEQLEKAKEWWNKNGKLVIGGIIVAIVAALSVQTWLQNQRQYMAMASAEYTQLLTYMDEDKVKAKGAADAITTDYADTLYASLAALFSAKLAADENDWAGASTKLQWITDNGSDDGIRHIARIRLAYVLMQQNKLDEALAIISGEESDAFKSEYAEVRGDILLAKGDKAGARESYVQALSASSLQGNNRLLQVKIDDLATKNNGASK